MKTGISIKKRFGVGLDSDGHFFCFDLEDREKGIKYLKEMEEFLMMCDSDNVSESDFAYFQSNPVSYLEGLPLKEYIAVLEDCEQRGTFEIIEKEVIVEVDF